MDRSHLFDRIRAFATRRECFPEHAQYSPLAEVRGGPIMTIMSNCHAKQCITMRPAIDARQGRRAWCKTEHKRKRVSSILHHNARFVALERDHKKHVRPGFGRTRKNTNIHIDRSTRTPDRSSVGFLAGAAKLSPQESAPRHLAAAPFNLPFNLPLAYPTLGWQSLGLRAQDTCR